MQAAQEQEQQLRAADLLLKHTPPEVEAEAQDSRPIQFVVADIDLAVQQAEEVEPQDLAGASDSIPYK